MKVVFQRLDYSESSPRFPNTQRENLGNGWKWDIFSPLATQDDMEIKDAVFEKSPLCLSRQFKTENVG